MKQSETKEKTENRKRGCRPKYKENVREKGGIRIKKEGFILIVSFFLSLHNYLSNRHLIGTC